MKQVNEVTKTIFEGESVFKMFTRKLLQETNLLDVVVHTLNPSIWETDAGVPL